MRDFPDGEREHFMIYIQIGNTEIERCAEKRLSRESRKGNQHPRIFVCKQMFDDENMRNTYVDFMLGACLQPCAGHRLPSNRVLVQVNDALV